MYAKFDTDGFYKVGEFREFKVRDDDQKSESHIISHCFFCKFFFLDIYECVKSMLTQPKR